MVDDLAVIRSCWCDGINHSAGVCQMNTGSILGGRPSLGSWVSYGLGTENANLPAFVTICPTLAHGGVNNWGSAFLPASFQGRPLGDASVPSDQARVRYIANTQLSSAAQRLQLDRLRAMNREHLARSGAEPSLEARIESFELAFRMQTEMPEVEDLSGESAATRRAPVPPGVCRTSTRPDATASGVVSKTRSRTRERKAGSPSMGL